MSKVTFESAQADERWWVSELSDTHALAWFDEQIESLTRQEKDIQVRLWALRDLKAQYERKGAVQ